MNLLINSLWEMNAQEEKVLGMIMGSFVHIL